MYTQQLGILDQLDKFGWRRIELEYIVHYWWAAEIWLLQSLWTPQECNVYLTFLVDPQWEGARHGIQGVHAVSASLYEPAETSKLKLYLNRGIMLMVNFQLFCVCGWTVYIIEGGCLWCGWWATPGVQVRRSTLS